MDPRKDQNMTNVADTHHALDTITLKRRMYTQLEYDDMYQETPDSKTVKDYIKSTCRCSKGRLLSGFLSIVPIINVFKRYQPKQFLLGDSLAGLSAAFLHLPQGLGFGLLASLAPVHGLYTSFFPVILYLIFGTCHHISFGTNALIALLTSNVLDREAEHYLSSAENATVVTDGELLNYKVGVAMAVTCLCGLILLTMGIFRLGFITMYLSMSFIVGFTTASAVHIATSQISKILRIKINVHSGPGKLIYTYVDIFRNISKTNPADVIISLLSFAILLGVKIGINEKFSKKLKIPVPIDLILVVIGTLISHLANLNHRFGVAIVGDVPTGMPVPTLPSLNILPRVASDSFVIAIIIFAMAIAMAKLMARQHDYDLNHNQELIAYGISNFVSSFFLCFPSTTAPPRTMILSSLGARTTLNGIPSAIFILIILLVAGQLFASLPIALLAAIIVVAIKNLLLQVRKLPNLWRTSKADFVIWISTFLICVFVDLDYGIVSGVAVSFLTVIVHTQLASGSLRGISVEEDILVPHSQQKCVTELPGIKIFHFSSVLFFANAEKFKREIFQKVFNPKPNKEPKPNDIKSKTDDNRNEADDTSTPLTNTEIKIHEENHIQHIIIDCSTMTFIDITGVDVLRLVVSKYRKVDTQVYLAGCGQYMLKTLHSAGFFEEFNKEHVFFEVWDALKAAKQKQSNVTESTT